MSHHLVTVCMFCLLCASHSSCDTHDANEPNNHIAAYKPQLIETLAHGPNHTLEEAAERRGKRAINTLAHGPNHTLHEAKEEAAERRGRRAIHERSRRAILERSRRAINTLAHGPNHTLHEAKEEAAEKRGRRAINTLAHGPNHTLHEAKEEAAEKRGRRAINTLAHGPNHTLHEAKEEAAEKRGKRAINTLAHGPNHTLHEAKEEAAEKRGKRAINTLAHGPNHTLHEAKEEAAEKRGKRAINTLAHGPNHTLHEAKEEAAEKRGRRAVNTLAHGPNHTIHEAKEHAAEKRGRRSAYLRDRRKRQAPVKDIKPNGYLEKIFGLYGDTNSMTMNLTGLNKMIEDLDLHKLVEGGVQNAKNIGVYEPNGPKDDAVNCLSSKEIITSVNSRLQPHDSNDDHNRSEHNLNIVTTGTLEAICPLLLYQRVAKTSLEQTGCVKENNIPIRRIETLESREIKLHEVENAYAKNSFAVWLYSSLSITAISACGLLGVAVIPIMHKTYYNHLLQFLVALAVGTLCGDALLHLMPHAMSPMEHDHGHSHDVSIVHSEDDAMWKGLAAMLGVVFFYFMEKGLTVVVEWRKRRQKLEEDKLPSRVRVLKDETVCGSSGGSKTPIVNSTSNSIMKIFKREEKSDPTTKMCKHKYSEYPYCYDEIETDTHDEHHHRDGQIPPSPKAAKNHNNSVSVVSSNALNAEAKDTEPTAKDWLLKADTNAVVEMNNIKHKEDDPKDLKDAESYTVILREHSRNHHGHSHAHGHVHAPPSSMSSVAWMVIMGDGLHNFTDGMAIGAAFASNIAGGFSTAIAVLCHELPHELGDFAVLLKAGMSVKRAVWYNVLSSGLCLIGMVCGVLAGHAPSATRWLFAAAAGMFLYIALVDMMPELSTSHSNEGTLCQCVLQLAGLASGIGIMLVIAMYEHDLKNLFG